MDAIFLNFLEEIDKKKCYNSIEFRLRFTSIWLRYREQKSSELANHLEQLITSYRLYNEMMI